MNLFINQKHQEEFDRNGFVKVSLFDIDDIKKIKDFYFDKIEQNQKKLNNSVFHTTSNSSDHQLIKQVNDFLRPIFVKNLSKVLINSEITIANYIIKEPSNVDSVGPHMDWTFVDEDQFVSFGIWVSLQNTTYKNGNMQFIPGSHKFFPSLRASPNCPIFYEKYSDRIKKFLVDVPTQAGESLIFRHNTIHASRKNLSEKSRLACVTAGYQKDAHLKHFYIDPNEENKGIESYAMTLDDFLALEHKKRPANAPYLGIVPFEYKEMPYADFVRLSKKSSTKFNVFKKKIIDFIY